MKIDIDKQYDIGGLQLLKGDKLTQCKGARVVNGDEVVAHIMALRRQVDRYQVALQLLEQRIEQAK